MAWWHHRAVVDRDDLLTAVDSEFEVTGASLVGWPDPHDGRSPDNDEYSRVTNPARWLILGARTDAWLVALERLGLATIERNVIVQATCHGTDNQALLDALRNSAGRARGVASVQTTVTDETLQSFHEAGVRGVRFNFVKRLVETLPHEALAEIVERISPFGWHTVIYFESQELAQLYDFFSSLPGTIIVDHMGRPDVSLPVDGAEFELFLKLLTDNDNFYSKVSCPERLSNLGPPECSDALPFAKTLIEAFPDRVLWGTDWPHPNMKSHMPDDGKLVDIIPLIAPTSSLQQKLLVDNPMNLYWPEEID